MTRAAVPKVSSTFHSNVSRNFGAEDGNFQNFATFFKISAKNIIFNILLKMKILEGIAAWYSNIVAYVISHYFSGARK